MVRGQKSLDYWHIEDRLYNEKLKALRAAVWGDASVVQFDR
jgi:hypothetical protein